MKLAKISLRQSWVNEVRIYSNRFCFFLRNLNKKIINVSFVLYQLFKSKHKYLSIPIIYGPNFIFLLALCLTKC
jgi:hypothetical protein